jgi:hypothetical protein
MADIIHWAQQRDTGAKVWGEGSPVRPTAAASTVGPYGLSTPTLDFPSSSSGAYALLIMVLQYSRTAHTTRLTKHTEQTKSSLTLRQRF